MKEVKSPKSHLYEKETITGSEFMAILDGLIAVIVGIKDIIVYRSLSQFTGFGPIISLVSGILRSGW